MSYHPMRRDLWTDTEMNIKRMAKETRCVDEWKECRNKIPSLLGVVNIDHFNGKTESTYHNHFDGSELLSTCEALKKGLGTHVNNISRDWKKFERPQAKGSSGERRRFEDAEEKEITIVFSNSDSGISQEMPIKPSTPLKSMFNKYSDECGMPLRSLRFTFNGSTLFLSSLGCKTANDLKLVHLDCISVVSNIQQPSSNSVSEPSKQSKHAQKGSSKRPNKKQQKKKRGSKPSQTIIMLSKSEEKAKETHSISLSKIFEEAEPLFKAIRQRLNNLSLDCESPKMRLSTSRKKEGSTNTVVSHSNTFGLGGKAGKSYYMVNVGQVENLYLSSKHNSIHSRSSSRVCASIDLHGCKRDEAISRLDEALVGWMDIAMKGEYPWVKPVKIICGGGSQILSETVESWIKEKRNVANAPKGSLSFHW